MFALVEITIDVFLYSDKIVSMKFMRKYIHIAKSIKPTLSKEACEVVAEEYSRLRSQDVEHADIARVSEVYYH